MLKLMWGVCTILVIVFGLYWTIKLRMIQFNFREMLASFKTKNKGISPFKSLTMSLASRIGVGSLAGVALAIYLGGKGVIFWMWVSAFIASSLAFCESVLGVVYQQNNANISYGGPSYYMKAGMNNLGLAKFYAFFILLAYIGGFLTIQANTITVSLSNLYSITPFIIGGVLAIITFISISGTITSLTRLTAFLVPVMTIAYLSCGIYVILINIPQTLDIIGQILKEALNFKSMGIGILTTALIGFQRGLFSNEAGLGTGAISAALVKDASPVKQGLVQVSGIYITTLICATVTAFIIMLAENSIDYSLFTDINGIELTSLSFNYHFGVFGDYILLITIISFAFSTIISGYYYGENSLKFLRPSLTKNHYIIFKVFVSILILIGSITKPTLIWNLVDWFVVILIIINIYSIYILRNDIITEYHIFKRKRT